VIAATKPGTWRSGNCKQTLIDLGTRLLEIWPSYWMPSCIRGQGYCRTLNVLRYDDTAQKNASREKKNYRRVGEPCLEPITRPGTEMRAFQRDKATTRIASYICMDLSFA
jgi:hypothetical protein